MKLRIPPSSLVVLVGASGSGKSTFAGRHFGPTEVVSSDRCRALVADDERNQSATDAAFELLHFLVDKRLAAGRLTVVDATNVTPEQRAPLVELTRRHRRRVIALVLDVPDSVCEERNRSRPARSFGPHVVRSQGRELRRSRPGLGREGFDAVMVVASAEEIDGVIVAGSSPDRRRVTGPFDVIACVHGCRDELEQLLTKLGYEHEAGRGYVHREGRLPVYAGDFVGHGPRVLETVSLIAEMVRSGRGHAVLGIHEHRLIQHLRSLPPAKKGAREADLLDFLESLDSASVFDSGALAVVGSGDLPPEASRGARLVRGGGPVAEPIWRDRAVNLNTGCVFGGSLTALSYPELELVSVAAKRAYAARPEDAGP